MSDLVTDIYWFVVEVPHFALPLIGLIGLIAAFAFSWRRGRDSN